MNFSFKKKKKKDKNCWIIDFRRCWLMPIWIAIGPLPIEWASGWIIWSSLLVTFHLIGWTNEMQTKMILLNNSPLLCVCRCIRTVDDDTELVIRFKKPYCARPPPVSSCFLFDSWKRCSSARSHVDLAKRHRLRFARWSFLQSTYSFEALSVRLPDHLESIASLSIGQTWFNRPIRLDRQASSSLGADDRKEPRPKPIKDVDPETVRAVSCHTMSIAVYNALSIDVELFLATTKKHWW